MKKLKISVLYWENRTAEGNDYDPVVDQVAKALEESGHEATLLGIHSELSELTSKLAEQKPDLVFNLCERFADNDLHEMHMTALLEMLGIPFTGTGPGGMSLQQDKAITKKLLKFHAVPYPNYATFERDRIEFAGNMRFPLFVKPLNGDASIGIDGASLVTEYSKLIERIDYIHKQIKVPALVEEYIEGRELYVGILGNDPPEPLPVMEFDFSKVPEGHPKIYSEAAKLDPESSQYLDVDALVATDLTPEIRARITRAGHEAAYALKVRDYARVDIRLSADGVPMVVEVNANPHLDQTSAFPMAAMQAGMPYAKLINRIVELAWERTGGTTDAEQPEMEPAEKAAEAAAE